jgi:hypothetical protein
MFKGNSFCRDMTTVYLSTENTFVTSEEADRYNVSLPSCDC